MGTSERQLLRASGLRGCASVCSRRTYAVVVVLLSTRCVCPLKEKSTQKQSKNKKNTQKTKNQLKEKKEEKRPPRRCASPKQLKQMVFFVRDVTRNRLANGGHPKKDFEHPSQEKERKERKTKT